MSKIFKLGDFFGITATQLILFRPEGFEKLLECKYTIYVNERIFSLIKEIECLKNVLNVDTVRPDYDAILDDFKMLGYLGINDSFTPAKAKGTMAKFYRDSTRMDIKDLAAKYENAVDILQIMSENIKIDISRTFPKLSNRVAQKIIDMLFKNIKDIDYYYDKCKIAYMNGQVGDTMIIGKSVRNILDLDSDNIDNNVHCCIFVNNLCGRIRLCKNELELSSLIDNLISNIETIMAGYEQQDIVYTTADELRELLSPIYAEMTVDKLNQLLGEDMTFEQYEEVFENLDECLIGGMGFNSESIGEEVLILVENDKRKSFQVSKKEHNEKLDTVLRIAYIDAMSRKYMSSHAG